MIFRYGADSDGDRARWRAYRALFDVFVKDFGGFSLAWVSVMFAWRGWWQVVG